MNDGDKRDSYMAYGRYRCKYLLSLPDPPNSELGCQAEGAGCRMDVYRFRL